MSCVSRESRLEARTRRASRVKCRSGFARPGHKYRERLVESKEADPKVRLFVSMRAIACAREYCDAWQPAGEPSRLELCDHGRFDRAVRLLELVLAAGHIR